RTARKPRSAAGNFRALIILMSWNGSFLKVKRSGLRVWRAPQKILTLNAERRTPNAERGTMTDSNDNIRLDKWLWAARFFKTRALAKDAIEGGKVHYEGQRCKVSKTPELGAKLTIRQGFDEKTVIIKALSGQRRGA